MLDKEEFHAPAELFDLAYRHGMMTEAQHEVAHALAEAESAARVDILTGLPNELAFAEQLEVAAARAERLGEPFSIASLDLADLSQWNERDHALGDRALQLFARAVSVGAHRATDSVYRISGDQFAAIFEGHTNAGVYLHEVKELLELPEYQLENQVLEFYPAFVQYQPETRRPLTTFIKAKAERHYMASQRALSETKIIMKDGRQASVSN